MSRTTRITLLAMIAAALVALAINATASQAHAATMLRCVPTAAPNTSGTAMCNGRVSQFPTYKGWGFIEGGACITHTGAVCDLSVPAWRWTGSTWARSSLAAGNVYVWPFATGWTWAWTSRNGWVAVESNLIQLQFSCRGVNNPLETAYDPARCTLATRTS